MKIPEERTIPHSHWPGPSGHSTVKNSWKEGPEDQNVINKIEKLVSGGSCTSSFLCQESLLWSPAFYVQYVVRNGTESAESYHTMERRQQEANQAILYRKDTDY